MPDDLASHYLPLIENELREVIGSDDGGLHEFYEMLHYHMGWGKHALGPAVSGKRIRPLIALLVCASTGGQAERALPAAAAVELIHNFSLIHDDIQDASPTRRGRPTVWAVWGRAQAINAGDALFALAHSALQRLKECGHSEATAMSAVRLLDETCLHLTQGQHLDMAFEGRSAVTVAEYMTMIEGKTAALFATSAELGALCAGIPDRARAHCREYGRSLGLAFQVRDDILGIWGDSHVTGKSAATDIIARKKTLPVVFGLEHGDRFQGLYAPEAEGGGSVRDVVRMLEATGAKEYAQSETERLTETALDHLAAAGARGEAGERLRELTGELLGRRA